MKHCGLLEGCDCDTPLLQLSTLPISITRILDTGLSFLILSSFHQTIYPGCFSVHCVCFQDQRVTEGLLLHLQDLGSAMPGWRVRQARDCLGLSGEILGWVY